MKKFLFYFMLINVFLFGSIEVKAASSCSYDDQAKMNSAAANVKINYEAKTAEMNPNDYQVPDAYLDTDLENSTLSYYYFQINILNLTNDMYAIITNDNNSDSVRVNYSDTTNGTYYYNWTNLNYIDAQIANNVAWSGVTDKPSTYPPTDHNHDSSYPSITGDRASGTWGINISGNAVSSTNASHASNADEATHAASATAVNAETINGQTKDLVKR